MGPKNRWIYCDVFSRRWLFHRKSFTWVQSETSTILERSTRSVKSYRLLQSFTLISRASTKTIFLITAGSAPKSLKNPSTKKANNCAKGLDDPTFRQISLINSKDESTTDKAIFNDRQDTKGRRHAARSIFSNTTSQSGITISTALCLASVSLFEQSPFSEFSSFSP